MRPPKKKQPQVKKGLCRVLEHVDVDEIQLDRYIYIFFFFFSQASNKLFKKTLSVNLYLNTREKTGFKQQHLYFGGKPLSILT